MVQNVVFELNHTGNHTTDQTHRSYPWDHTPDRIIPQTIPMCRFTRVSPRSTHMYGCVFEERLHLNDAAMEVVGMNVGLLWVVLLLSNNNINNNNISNGINSNSNSNSINSNSNSNSNNNNISNSNNNKSRATATVTATTLSIQGADKMMRLMREQQEHHPYSFVWSVRTTALNKAI